MHQQERRGWSSGREEADLGQRRCCNRKGGRMKIGWSSGRDEADVEAEKRLHWWKRTVCIDGTNEARAA